MENKKQIFRFYLTLALLYIGGGLLLWLNPPSSINTVENNTCLINRITGVPCPGCGVGHGIHEIITLHWKAAFMANPFAYFAFFFALIFPFWTAADIIRRRFTLYLWSERVNRLFKRVPLLFILLAMLFIANWIWNIYKY